MVELVVLLGIENAPSRRGKEGNHDEQDGEGDPLHIPDIGRRELIFHARGYMYGRSADCSCMEIVRCSGYTEVDAGAEAALCASLFSQVDGRKDTAGTVVFRFRLESLD